MALAKIKDQKISIQIVTGKNKGYSLNLQDSVVFVTSKDGNKYKIRGGRCSCPGFKYRGECKHISMSDEHFGTVISPFSFKNPMNVEQAKKVERNLYKLVKNCVEKYEACGSFRRGKKEIGDIDVMVILKPKFSLLKMVLFFKEKLGEKSVKKYGKAGWDITLVFEDRQINFMMTKQDSWGFSLLHATGSSKFNIVLRGRIKRQGGKLNQYEYVNKKGKRYKAKTEEQAFKVLGLPFIKPKDRKPEILDKLTEKFEASFEFDPNSTKNEGRWRLIDPKEFNQKTLRYYPNLKKEPPKKFKELVESLPEGIRVIIGDHNSEEKKIQTIRFKKDIWTEEKALIWWNQRKNDFEKTWIGWNYE